MKPHVTLIQHRGKPDNGTRYAPEKQQRRAVFGAAVNPYNLTERPVSLPRIEWCERIDAKYGSRA